jgi:2-deoxy-D-gluconate 3-dehydrogenase
VLGVNAIAPGYIDTDNLIGLNETRLRQIMDRIPAGRLGKPEDLV